MQFFTENFLNVPDRIFHLPKRGKSPGIFSLTVRECFENSLYRVEKCPMRSFFTPASFAICAASELVQ